MLPFEGENSWGGSNKIEYYFTINAGKHIGMVSLTEKGNELREYFIGVENGTVIPLRKQQPKSRLELAKENAEKSKLIAEMAENEVLLIIEIEEKDDEIKLLKPAAEHSINLEESGMIILTRDLAKLIEQRVDIKIGEKLLFRWFIDNKFLMNDGETIPDFEYKTTKHFPYQRYAHYFHVKPGSYPNKKGERIPTFTTYIKVSGQKYFLNRIVKEIQEGIFVIPLKLKK